MSAADSRRPVTLITGTSRGLGEGLARHLLSKGHVVLGCSRSAASIQAPDYHHHQLDLESESAIREMFGRIREKWGTLDHLINNAAVSTYNLASLTPGSAVKKLLRINFVAPFILCQEAHRLMSARKAGRIVNVSSVAVRLEPQALSAYTASKAALESLTRTLARELAPFGITVNCVGPSLIDTELSASLPEPARKWTRERLPLPEAATAKDFHHAVDFLLAPESSQITGQIFYLGGA